MNILYFLSYYLRSRLKIFTIAFGITFRTIRYAKVFIENGFFANIFTFSSKVYPYSLKNSVRLGVIGKDLTNAGFLVVNSLY